MTGALLIPSTSTEMTSMTAADFGDKRVVSNQLNSTIFGEDPGTAVYVPGAQGGMPKISSKNFRLKNEVSAALMILYISTQYDTQNTLTIANKYFEFRSRRAEELLLKHEDDKLVLTIVSVENLHIH
jgi:hypothetical protein